MRKHFEFDDIYEHELSPLIKKIHNVCDKYGIPYFATYVVFFDGDEENCKTSTINGYHDNWSDGVHQCYLNFIKIKEQKEGHDDARRLRKH